MDQLKDLREGLSIEAVCAKYDMSFLELFELAENYFSYPAFRKYENYGCVRKFKNRWTIVNPRTGNNIGSFIDKKECVEKADKLKKNNFEGVTKAEYLGDKFIYHSGEHSWEVRKLIEPECYLTYARAGDLETARKIRNKLYLCNWDRTQLNRILKEVREEDLNEQC